MSLLESITYIFVYQKQNERNSRIFLALNATALPNCKQKVFSLFMM